MEGSGNDSPERVGHNREQLLEPVNLEWELLKLTGDHPAFCVYAQVRDVNSDEALSRQIDGQPTDRAWISITSSMYSAPPRVLVTPDELDAIAHLCRKVASALRAREEVKPDVGKR